MITSHKCLLATKYCTPSSKSLKLLSKANVIPSPSTGNMFKMFTSFPICAFAFAAPAAFVRYNKY